MKRAQEIRNVGRHATCFDDDDDDDDDQKCTALPDQFSFQLTYVPTKRDGELFFARKVFFLRERIRFKSSLPSRVVLK